MALPFDCSNEEYFEFDFSSEILEISTSSHLSSNSAADDEVVDGEDAEPYTLEQGTVPVPFDSLILVNVKRQCPIKEIDCQSNSMAFKNVLISVRQSKQVFPSLGW